MSASFAGFTPERITSLGNAVCVFRGRKSAGGYLVGGGQFSVADLAVAALLSITANPDHPDMKRPEPMFNTTRAWMDRWKDHPGTRWINEMYAKRRPA